MSEKVFGSPVAFSDYAWKNLSDTIAVGLDLGLHSIQTMAITVYNTQLDTFKAGNLNDVAAFISSQAGMTLQYLRVSWNEVDAGTDEYGEPMTTITDMDVGLVVNTSTAGNAYGVLAAMFYSDWWSNIVRYTNPDDGFVAYVLNPCPIGYHYDPSAGACVHDTCQTGYHWDTATQTCVIDTSTNCPVGTHWDPTQSKCIQNTTNCPTGTVWDPTQAKCVAQTNGQGFPWVPVLAGIGIVSAVAVGGYYLYKRKKRSKARQNNIEPTQNTPALPYR